MEGGSEGARERETYRFSSTERAFVPLDMIEQRRLKNNGLTLTFSLLDPGFTELISLASSAWKLANKPSFYFLW